ncbi:hypothetical protein [Solihabitans fulvus]|uniref:hypothetical protein n=1 Tax=Solihabitans fulvus TaxID=1892852 RepID=UPI001661B3E1|nr:hypothetical protein [Solihabitans fulvus]
MTGEDGRARAREIAKWVLGGLIALAALAVLLVAVGAVVLVMEFTGGHWLTW